MLVLISQRYKTETVNTSISMAVGRRKSVGGKDALIYSYRTRFDFGWWVHIAINITDLIT